MNSNYFQTILTVVAGILAMATTILLSMGCTDIADKISCVASSAPTWIAPYLAIAASAIGVLKVIIGAFTGKLTKQTAVIATTGDVGTVHPNAVVGSKW